MLSKTIQKFLDTNKIKYEVIEHKTVYTAFDKAATLRAKPTEVGKTVIVCFDSKNYVLGLIPANKNLDQKKVLAAFNKLRAKNKEKNYQKIDFAKEQWMKNNFKGIDLGSTPPLGTLYKLPFFIDNSLLKPAKIVVNGGAYELSIKLAPASSIKLNSGTLIKGSFSIAKK